MSLDPKQINEFDETPDDLFRADDVLELERKLDVDKYKNEKKTLSKLFISDGFGGTIKGVEDETHIIILAMPFAGKMTKLTTQMTSGTCTVKIKINGTDVTGGTIASTTSKQNSTMTALNEYVENDVVQLVVSSSAATPEGLSFSLKLIRKII